MTGNHDLVFVLDDTSDAGMADSVSSRHTLPALEGHSGVVVRVAYRGAEDESGNAGDCFSGYISKPASRMSIIRCLRPLDVLDTKPSATRAKETAVAASSESEGDLRQTDSGLNILLAEDNIVNQRVLTAMLVRAGHKVEIVENGAEALSTVQTGPFDVVLMDINMPEMDGVAAARAIRALGGKVGEIPIIAVTANALRGDRQKYLEAGMDDYVAKPVNANLLNAALERSRLTGESD